MYHMEWFNAKDPAELRRFAREELLPYWREVGKFRVWLLESEENLASHQFCLITEMDRLGDIDGWPARAQGDDKGKELMARFRQLRVNPPIAAVMKNIDGLSW